MALHPQLETQNPVHPPRPKAAPDQSKSEASNFFHAKTEPSIEAQLIRAQVERIIASEPFRKSARYPRFLKFIVDQTLAGNADQLKERTLGMEVFDRPPDYELKTDPIVRVAAGELRKRLAQYYILHTAESELRIELHPGSYVPEFHWPSCDSIGQLLGTQEQASDSSTSIPFETKATLNHKRIGTLLFAALLLVAFTVLFILKLTSRPSASEAFWAPMLKANTAPLICIGDAQDMFVNSPYASSVGSGEVQRSSSPNIVDVNIANSISEMLATHGKRAYIQDSSLTTMNQLNRQPVILIGWRNNRWSQSAVQMLRYRLENGIGNQARIVVDRQDPSHPQWIVSKDLISGGTGETYAIIARFTDPASGQPTVLIAGIGIAGCVAAASFITNEHFLQDSFRNAPRGWEKKNIELVIGTHVMNGINGVNGPPHLVASYVW